jgi:hypothetical protein
MSLKCSWTENAIINSQIAFKQEEFNPKAVHPILSVISILTLSTPPTSWVFLVVSFLLAFPPISYMHSSLP